MLMSLFDFESNSLTHRLCGIVDHVAWDLRIVFSVATRRHKVAVGPPFVAVFVAGDLCSALDCSRAERFLWSTGS